MVEYKSLELPQEIADGFRHWSDDYLKRLDGTTTFDVTAFNDEGRRLARLLKQFVGPATRIVFAPEAEDGGLGAEEEILA